MTIHDEKSLSRRAWLATGTTALAAACVADVSAEEKAWGEPRKARLLDKVALITGAARGIGRATALRFAREGADVVALDIAADIPSIPYPLSTLEDLAETQRLVRELGRRCLTVRADVRDAAQVRAAVDQALRSFGTLDILFANAGVATLAEPLISMSDRAWRDVLEVNLFGIANAFRAVLPHMVEQKRGVVIATASVGARIGTPGVANYGAAKWGVLGLVKTAALEVGKSGVRVNAVCPTFIDTVLTTQGTSLPGSLRPSREELEQAARQAHALDVGILPPDEVASAVAFLASDDARYITGEIVDVAAGSNARWSA